MQMDKGVSHRERKRERKKTKPGNETNRREHREWKNEREEEGKIIAVKKRVLESV